MALRDPAARPPSRVAIATRDEVRTYIPADHEEADVPAVEVNPSLEQGAVCFFFLSRGACLTLSRFRE